MIQSQRWTAFECMRHRCTLSRLMNSLEIWQDVHWQKRAAACEESKQHAITTNKIASSLFQKRLIVMSSCLTMWKESTYAFLYVCRMLHLNLARSRAWLLCWVLQMWKKHVEHIQALILHRGFRNGAGNVMTHYFLFWANSVLDPRNAVGTSRQQTVGFELPQSVVEMRTHLVERYIKTKRKTFTFRRLQTSWTIWCERNIRRKVLEDWAINLYSSRRLRRIEKEIGSQYLGTLVRLAFHTIGEFVQEKRKFQHKLGELRSSFACTSALVPASPSVAVIDPSSAAVFPKTPSPPSPIGRYETISEQVAPSYLEAKVFWVQRIFARWRFCVQFQLFINTFRGQIVLGWSKGILQAWKQGTGRKRLKRQVHHIRYLARLSDAVGLWREEINFMPRIISLWQVISGKLLDRKYHLVERARNGAPDHDPWHKNSGENVTPNRLPLKSQFAKPKETIGLYNPGSDAKSSSEAKNSSALEHETPVGDNERIVLRRWWRVLAKYAESSPGTTMRARVKERYSGNARYDAR